MMSSDVYLLMSIAELAKRYGMQPSEADASIMLVSEKAGEIGNFVLSFTGMTIAKQANFDRLAAALGLDDDGQIVASKFSDLEEAVERALSLAPKPRAR